MAGANLFYFRHFVIDQSLCAMKVGADSMLLGSLIEVGNADNILDIGTGTGVLSLMLAQRTSAKIDAIEVDEDAYTQAVKNASDSSWKNRIQLFHTSLQNYKPPIDLKYDMIISNPPYFPASNSSKSKSADKSRSAARDRELLSFTDLIFHTCRLLNADGIFYVIIPFNEKDNFIKLARNFGLYLQEIIKISSRREAKFIRSILKFSFHLETEPVEKEFTIYEEGNIYTEEYIRATEKYHAQDMRKKRNKSAKLIQN